MKELPKLKVLNGYSLEKSFLTLGKKVWLKNCLFRSCKKVNYVKIYDQKGEHQETKLTAATVEPLYLSHFL